MEFFKVVNSRRSIRKFLNEKVPSEVIKKSLDAAIVAPNSSNLQPWEFYWVQTPEKKEKLVRYCLNQSAARTASDLIVCVSRIDTWKRNKNLLLENYKNHNKEIPKIISTYYEKLIPFTYFQDPLGAIGVFKKCLFNIIGFFRIMPRGPGLRSELFEVVTKTTALACQNFMLSIRAQDYDTCPMEGFDESRVKKLLGLNRNCHVAMVIGVGKVDPTGRSDKQFRINKDLVIKKV